MTDNKKKALTLIFLPVLINLLVSIYIFLSMNLFYFAGYLTGTLLSATLVVIWLVQVKIGLGANTIAFFKTTFAGFALKLMIFTLVSVGGYFFFSFDRMFFALAFLSGTLISVILQIRYYLTIIISGKFRL